MGLDMYLSRARKLPELSKEEMEIVRDSIESNHYSGDVKIAVLNYIEAEDKEFPLDKLDCVNDLIEDIHNPYSFSPDYRTVEKQVGSWRKANAIHGWFVKHVQDGVDECQSHIVSKKKLQDLLHACNKVKESAKNMTIKSLVVSSVFKNGERYEEYGDVKVMENTKVADKFLPTQSGFFFGGTEYTEWYLKDIDDTIQILETTLTETDFDNFEISYCSSW